WALAFERLWPRLWLVLGVVGLFILVSLAGIWPHLGTWPHKILLAAFVVALIAALINAVRIPWPSREDAIRRIERRSGVAHRPATSYEDTLSAGRNSPETMAIWQAHRKRLSDMLARLHVGPPEPATHRHDPLALRALMVLGVAALLALTGDRSSDRIGSAFRFDTRGAIAEARLDAWITPPAYTLRPPMMLADGSKPGAQGVVNTAGVIEAPERSVLIVRSSGATALRLALEITPEDAQISNRPAERREAAELPGTSGVSEIRYELKSGGTLRVLGSGTELAAWTFSVIPDAPPAITLTKDLERTARGSMKIHFKATDDYGVAAAAARFEKVKAAAPDPKKAWARRDVLKGPRPPLERPPVMALRLPKPNSKEVEGNSYLELGQHPWAGLRVAMRLEAKDVAGQTGLSSPIELIMPERRFEKPLARAIVEQRRKLVDDPRYRGEVLRALAALTLGPEDFGVEPKIYLLMRSAQHRLARDTTRAGRNSVIEQLWHIALKIEDGDLSDAEKRLKDAQEKLSKALENGASEDEIRQLMQEMKQALNDYMRELQKEAAANQSEMPEGSDPNNQTLSQQDLERMMKNIEDMAKSGAREQAQQMLSEMRDLMERMQSGRMAKEQQKQNREAMQKMDELGNMVGEQQKLMDDTFSEMREQDQQGQPRGQGQQRGQQQGQPKQGQGQQRGQQQGQQGQKGQQGQRGQGQQQGQQQGEGQQGQGQRTPGSKGQLGQRQSGLSDKLGKLQRDMRDLGMGDSQQLEDAREAMESAERALQEGDLSEATEDQGRALDQMRQGAQAMAQEMMKNMPQRYGQNGDSPRDPMGRPQRSEGPDPGTSVKVPDAIDMQRAREILEELRRRSGEATRPPVELDYLERLLKRF
ncbi:MAG: TIGR02302 family protein, partial [Hyphomicrobium sp.]